MADMRFVRTGRGYQMAIPADLNLAKVKAAALTYAQTEDDEYYLHPEVVVSSMPLAEALQSQMRQLAFLTSAGIAVSGVRYGSEGKRTSAQDRVTLRSGGVKGESSCMPARSAPATPKALRVNCARGLIHIRKASPLSVPVKKPKVTWVDPEVEYGALTDDGLLREAVFKGLRDDPR